MLAFKAKMHQIRSEIDFRGVPTGEADKLQPLYQTFIHILNNDMDTEALAYAHNIHYVMLC